MADQSRAVDGRGNLHKQGIFRKRNAKPTIDPTMSFVAHARVPVLVNYHLIGQKGDAGQDQRHAPGVGVVRQKPMLGQKAIDTV